MLAHSAPSRNRTLRGLVLEASQYPVPKALRLSFQAVRRITAILGFAFTHVATNRSQWSLLGTPG
jgi:hypothetical protein